jgi:transposase
MIAAIGDGSDFKNGRHLAAWLGSCRVSIRVATAG